MENVLLVVHLIIALAMILLILIQRTAQDGGGLMGGGGTMGGMFTARGGANMLSRTTAILAGLFIITSLALTMLAQHTKQQDTITDQIAPLVAPATNNDTPAVPAASPDASAPPAVPMSK